MKELVTRIKLESKDFIKDMESGKGAALAFSAAVGTAAAGVAMLAMRSADTIERTNQLARASGELTNTFSALAFAGKLGNVGMEELSSGMAKMAKPEQRKNLQAMGIAVLDVNGKLRSQTDILLDLSDKISKTEDPMKRLQIAQAGLGKSGGQYIEFLKDGPGAIKALMEEAKDLGQVFTEQDAAAADLFNDKLDTLKAGVEGVGLSLGKSVIQWVNHTGVMDLAIGAVKSVIAAWNGLDDSTKEFIFNFGAAVAVITAVGSAAYGLSVIIPLVGKAITAAFVTNPIGLFVTALALAAAGILYMRNNWEKFEKFFAPAIGMFREFRATAAGAFDKVSSTIGGLGDKLAPLSSTFKNISEAFKNTDLVATALKATMVPLLTTFYSVALAIGIVSDALQVFVKIMRGDFGKALFDMIVALHKGPLGAVDLANAVTRIGDAWGQAKDDLAKFAEDSKKRLAGFSDNVSATVKNVITKTEDAKKLYENLNPPAHDTPENLDTKPEKVVQKPSNEFYELASAVMETKKAFAELSFEGKTTEEKMNQIGMAMEPLKNVIKGVTGQLVQLYQAQAQLEQTKFNNFKQNSQYMLGAINKFAEIELKGTQDRLDSEIAALNDQKQSMLDEERAYQQKLKEIRDEYASQRRIELDEELQREFDRLDLLYTKQVQMLESAGITGLELEARKADALAEKEAKKNQAISASEKRLQKDIEKKNKDLDADAQAKADTARAREEELAAKIQALQDQKDAAAEASAAKKEALEKATKIMEWNAGRASFEMGKKAQMAQAVSSTAMALLNAVQAGLLLAATVPVVGWILGPIMAGVLSAMALSAGATAISTISSMQYPPPPLFDDGGISTGETRGNGWMAKDAEMHIPLDNPGKDFGALKAEVAKLLVPSGGERRANIDKLEINNHFHGESYEQVKDKLSRDLREMVDSALIG